MGLLQLLNFPSLGTTVGLITRIVNAKEAGAQGMTWSYSNQGGIVSNGRSYTNTLLVETNSPFVGPIQIQQELLSIGCLQGASYRFPLPEYNGSVSTPTTPTEQDTGSFLHTINIKQDAEDAMSWKVTFEYGPFDINHESGAENTSIGVVDPLQQFPDAKWAPAIFEEYYPQDANGLPFLNIVGDPIEDPPKRTVSRQTFSFTRNEANYNDAYAANFRQTVNKSTFLGFAPNQVKCSSIDGERIYQADWGVYWRVNYQFEMKVAKFKDPNDGSVTTYGWEDLVLNAGFRKRNTDGTIVPILVNGQPISSPMGLTADGIPINSTWALNNNPSPRYLVFMQYSSSEFGDLNIPDTVFTDNQ